MSMMLVSAMVMMMAVVVMPPRRGFRDASPEQKTKCKNGNQVTQPESLRYSQIQSNHYYYVLPIVLPYVWHVEPPSRFDGQTVGGSIRQERGTIVLSSR